MLYIFIFIYIMTKETKIILILTSQRCGSTHLLELIGNNIINLEYKYEIFINEDIANAKEFLDNHKQNCDKPFFMFKLMYSQINDDLINLLKCNYFDYIINLNRVNMLDVHISKIKMKEIKQFKSYDTTNYKIKFNINEYLIWKKRILDWKNKYLNEINQSILYYEYNELFDSNKVINKLNNFIPELKKSEKIFVKLQKQDLSVDYKDKIINYNECKEFIENELKTFDN